MGVWATPDIPGRGRAATNDMAFSLTITEGKDRGRQYVFDQPEVTLGRTAGVDLLLVDSGVSRRHVSIRQADGRFVVRDLGSSNGTLVNGQPVSEGDLHPGDELTVGPVVLRFEVAAAGGNEQAIAESKALAKKPAADVAQLRRRTTSLPSAPSQPAASALKAPRAVPAILRRPAPLSASERARFLRERGRLAPVLLVLRGLAPLWRWTLVGGLVLVLLLPLVRLFGASEGDPLIGMADRSRDRFELSEEASDQVFGFGEELGVNAQTRDEVHFDFEVSDTIPSAYYVRFESQGIEKAEEVEISLNGAHIGTVTPGLGGVVKVQRLKLPRKFLKPNASNELVFDNSFNPPNAEPWALSRVRLQVKPLPQDRPAELVREAKRHFDLAEQLLGMRDIGHENRYEAWNHLQKAQLFLESLEPKPELSTLVQQSLREADRELETKCNQILLAARHAEEMNDGDRALQEYKSGLKWFPGEDHPCRGRLAEKLDEMGEPVPR